MKEMHAWVKTRLSNAGLVEDLTMAAPEEEDDEEEPMPKELTIWDHVTNAVGEV